jgi:hypothetical protein
VKMAERFVGMTVALTLSNNAQLKGTVSKVDSTTQILHLHDGTVNLTNTDTDDSVFSSQWRARIGI